MRRETDLLDRLNPVARTDIPRRTNVGKLPPYKTHKHTLSGKEEGHRAGCQHHFPLRSLTVDHIWAKSKGGTDDLDNHRLLCGACNTMKGPASQAAFVARLRTEGIGKEIILTCGSGFFSHMQVVLSERIAYSLPFTACELNRG